MFKVLEMEQLGGSELLQRQLDDSRQKHDELKSNIDSKDSVRKIMLSNLFYYVV